MAKAVTKKATTADAVRRKNIERGAAHIQSTFNNTIVTITDVQGNALQLGKRRWSGLQRLQKIHSICRTDGCGNRCQSCDGTWTENR